MKVLVIFTLTALLGIASCDMTCMQFKLSSCFASIAVRHYTNPICAGDDELSECLRRGARECDVESSPIVKDVIAIYSETCREGTQMNDQYKKHQTCVFQDAAIGNSVCLRPILTEVLTMGYPSQTRSYQKRILKVACKYSDSGNKCIDDNINATCGSEATLFRRRLSGPAVRLSDQACVEVEAETNEIQYAGQQHEVHSVDAKSPHIQHLSATGLQAGGIHVASTVATNEIVINSATINVSSNLIYILIATIFMKWFSPY